MERILQQVGKSPSKLAQQVVGGSILVVGAALLMQQLSAVALPALLSMLVNPVQAGVLKASAIAGVATGLGGMAVLVLKKIDDDGLGLFMAISAGMMAAAAVFSLLLPAFSQTNHIGWVMASVIGGFATMALMDKALPHEHPMEHEESYASAKHTALLMTVAIALHNLPEGFAVGATPAAGAAGTAMSIGLQNLPEGMIVATALWAAGIGKVWASALALLTGLIEPVGAAVGIATASHWEMGSEVAMGLAAGAMLFVVMHEIWPEAKARLKSVSPARVALTATVSTAGVLQWIA